MKGSGLRWFFITLNAVILTWNFVAPKGDVLWGVGLIASGTVIGFMAGLEFELWLEEKAKAP